MRKLRRVRSLCGARSMRKLEQVLTAKPHAGLTEELLELLKADPRISQQATKSEL